jgi:hypothetical protein
MPIRYDLIDSRTGQLVRSYSTRAAASRAADKRDLAYGAVRYLVQPVWGEA